MNSSLPAVKNLLATAAVVSAMVGGASAALVHVLATELRRDPAPVGFASDAPSSSPSGASALESDVEALQLEARELRRRLEELEDRAGLDRRSGRVPSTEPLAD